MYLEMDEGYHGHRKTLRLCALMKCDTADAYPPRLWAWAVRSAPDGDLTGMDPGEIEMAVRYRKQDGALFAALCTAGFVDRSEDGQVSIHNWRERTGAAIARMADKAYRLKEARAHKTGSCLPACRLCTGTDQAQTQQRAGLVAPSPDKASQDQSRSEREPPAGAPAIPWHQDVPQRPVLHPFGTNTAAFQRLKGAYKNTYGEHGARAEFAHLASHHPGGADGLAVEILTALDRLKKSHPYNGPANFWPGIEKFLVERKWLDAPTPTETGASNGARGSPPRDVRIGHVQAEVKERPSGEVPL